MSYVDVLERLPLASYLRAPCKSARQALLYMYCPSELQETEKAHSRKVTAAPGLSIHDTLFSC